MEQKKQYLKVNNNTTTQRKNIVSCVAEHLTEDLEDTVVDIAANISANRLENCNDLMYELGVVDIFESMLTSIYNIVLSIYLCSIFKI